MANQEIEDIRTSSNIPTDIPPEPPVYPGKPLMSPGALTQRRGVVEEKTGESADKLASEQNFKPVASVRYPNKNIHVVPLTNTKKRGVSPVALSGSVTLPVKGENVVDLDEDIRRPLENRLGRLLEGATVKIAAPTQPPEQSAAQPTANIDSAYVKTELDKLKDLAKQELAKRQAKDKLPIIPINTSLGSVVGEKNPATTGGLLLPKQPEPKAPNATVETTKADNNLMGQAQALEEELKALQQNLLSRPVQPPQQTNQQTPTGQQDYYTGQLNQLLKDKTDLLNKVNELALAYQQEGAARQKAQQKLYSVTNDFNIKLAGLQKERDELQKRVAAVEKRQAQEPPKQVEQRSDTPAQTQVLKQQLTASETEKQTMKSQIQKLEGLVQQLGGAKPTSDQKQGVVHPEQAVRETTGPTARIVKPQTAVGRMAPSLTTAPNVINGIVKDSKGMLLSNIIIVVKSDNGEPVRALKTNKIGQFAISTPLPNGTYVMELESPEHTFDLVQVDVKGQVLPPIEIRSHN